jgi:DNA-binding transcriptional ArsR family regulator
VAKRTPLPEAARLFRALSDETRLQLLLLLLAEPGAVMVGDLADAAGAGRSATSFHLQAVRRAGLVAHRVEGRHYYTEATAVFPVRSS